MWSRLTDGADRLMATIARNMVALERIIAACARANNSLLDSLHGAGRPASTQHMTARSDGAD
jgi:hypothetical protein